MATVRIILELEDGLLSDVLSAALEDRQDLSEYIADRLTAALEEVETDDEESDDTDD